MYKSAFDKQAGIERLLMGIAQAGRAAKAATPLADGAGMAARYMNRLNAAKEGFRSVVDPSSSTYAVAKYLYNLPGRMFGPTFSGRFGYGGGARWTARRLGANGHWTVDPKTGSTSWVFDGVRSGDGVTMRQRVGDWLANAGTKAEAQVANATAKGNAAAEQLASNGHHALGFAARHLGGPFTGAGLAIGAPLASAYMFGGDSLPTKALTAASGAAFLPARFMNPLGLGIEGAYRGLSWGGQKFTNMATDAAEQAALNTADGIADNIQNQNRLAFMYGAISPEAFAAKLREAARAGVKDRFSTIRKTMQQ